MNSVGMNFRLCMARLKNIGVGRTNTTFCYVTRFRGLFLCLKVPTRIISLTMISRVDSIRGKHFGFTCSDAFSLSFRVR